MIVACLLLGLLALGAPAVALAGGSAGDQQYTDPFGAGTTTTSAARDTATATTPATTPASATTPAATPTAADPAPAQTSTGSQPTATVAGTASSLPYTGYDTWMAAGFGAVMLATGLGLRLQARRS